MVLPNPIDHHAGGEWVLRRRHPVGEGSATARRNLTGWSRLDVIDVGCRRQSRRDAGLNFSARLPVLAATENMVRRRIWVGFNESRNLAQRPRSVLLALGNRLLDAIAEGGIFREALRKVVVRDFH